MVFLPFSPLGAVLKLSPSIRPPPLRLVPPCRPRDERLKGLQTSYRCDCRRWADGTEGDGEGMPGSQQLSRPTASSLEGFGLVIHPFLRW